MKDTILRLIDKLETCHILSREEFFELLSNRSEETLYYLQSIASKIRKNIYSNDVYIRGLIEFTNYCKNDCYYCGIRKSNIKAQRYRLTKEEILDCCKNGYNLGFRTFVLQGGEDPFYNDDLICDIVSSIRNLYKDCAITLSIGEKEKSSYEKYFIAGANRYLLRHETANREHYSLLHPNNMTLKNRIKCLNDLKDIGYQVGCGIMVGSPFQTIETIIEDLFFMKELNPHMIGIGPFIPHKDTPFGKEEAGDLELTLYLLAIIRLILPNVLMPSTTALGTISKNGREQGILSGANVVMPNLSPTNVREKYMLYDNKICTGDEAAECFTCINRRMESIGFKIPVSRGDYKI